MKEKSACLASGLAVTKTNPAALALDFKHGLRNKWWVMKVMVVGSGGREHALAWKLSQSPRVSGVFCAPGNPGTGKIACNQRIGALDIPGLLEFAEKNRIDLTVVGPDDALAAGIADAFEAAGKRIFGPRKASARLESSKSFAKDFMRRHGIPTAAAAEFDNLESALAYCRTAPCPMVVKADGLALGKGVIIANTRQEAEAAVRSMMETKVFGTAGERVVIEEFLTGAECSIHAFVDGKSWLLCPDCKDHKRAGENDTGPNTGGMGTISPTGLLDDALWEIVRREILDRFVAGCAADGLDFRGLLFPGLMLTSQGPKVLEFNCRFGDPETQSLMRRLDSDLLDLLEATAEGRLETVDAKWSSNAAVCVVMASQGYPGPIEKGKPVSGIEAAEHRDGVVVFHAGTALNEAGMLVTAGGRVLGVTATGPSMKEARGAAYEATRHIGFPGAFSRPDIGGPSEIG